MSSWINVGAVDMEFIFTLCAGVMRGCADAQDLLRLIGCGGISNLRLANWPVETGGGGS